MKTTKTLIASMLILFGALVLGSAQGTAFTYQGRLVEGGAPASGSYDFIVRLYNVASGGSALTFNLRPGTKVTNGLFTVSLDLGNNFDGSARWLQLEVATNGVTA